MLVLTNVTNPFAPLKAGVFFKVSEAEALLAKRGTVVAFEEDRDNPGHYDAAVSVPGDILLFTLEPLKDTAPNDPLDDFNYVGSRHHY